MAVIGQHSSHEESIRARGRQASRQGPSRSGVERVRCRGLTRATEPREPRPRRGPRRRTERRDSGESRQRHAGRGHGCSSRKRASRWPSHRRRGCAVRSDYDRWMPRRHTGGTRLSRSRRPSNRAGADALRGAEEGGRPERVGPSVRPRHRWGPAPESGQEDVERIRRVVENPSAAQQEKPDQQARRHVHSGGRKRSVEHPVVADQHGLDGELPDPEQPNGLPATPSPSPAPSRQTGRADRDTHDAEDDRRGGGQLPCADEMSPGSQGGGKQRGGGGAPERPGVRARGRRSVPHGSESNDEVTATRAGASAVASTHGVMSMSRISRERRDQTPARRWEWAVPEQPEEPEQPPAQGSRRWSGPLTVLAMLVISVGSYAFALLDSDGAGDASPVAPDGVPAVTTTAPTPIPPISVPTLPSAR